ncbi:copper resistance CopC family protein [Virgibacillus salexigens]|uniref:copper resistance CopC family protein n=1 Tax=Virgibacillus salexigens TaxID=61016 RepID=UPI00190AACC2|nr:copper resistance protein CopC [Virgibacillus salexigens]
MKKLTTIFVATTIFLYMAPPVFAHTHLASSNPEAGATVTEPMKEMTLSFDTVIEQTATLELENSNGTLTQVDNISINDDGELHAVFDQALENGEYTAKWEIIGVDGHPMEDSITFTVDVEESVEEDTANEETAPTEEDAAETDEDNTVSPANETESNQAEQDNSNVILIAILVVAIIAIIVIVRLKRKK